MPPLYLNETQRKTLNAILDAFIAPLSSEEQKVFRGKLKQSSCNLSETQVSAMASISATSLGILPIVIKKLENISKDKQDGFLQILTLLSTRPGSFLMTGSWTPLMDLDSQRRQEIMYSWKTSSLRAFRLLFKTFSSLSLFVAYNQTNSPLNDCIGFDAAHGDSFFENHPDYSPIEHARLPMMTTQEALRGPLKFDAVVVGSGAGGGVAAAVLAKQGLSVLVIERGKYYHQSEMDPFEEAAYDKMYDTGSSINSENGTIDCLSGATLGGGTAVNYLVSLKPQHFVREEWARTGLDYFISPEFNQDLDTVFNRIGASQENVLATKANQKFEKGCKELGYPIEMVYVNTKGLPHHCSRCMYGCRSGIKQSTANTWLQDAHQHGAFFLDRTEVTQVLTDRQKAIGVECIVHDSQKKIVINASRVIVACGALRTPSLLRASGLSNRNIGKHLRLQPIMFGFALFDEEIRQTEGPLITRVSDVDGDAKIEEGLVLPGALASRLPWRNAAEHKQLMLRHQHVLSLINVVRDQDSEGTVLPGSNPAFEFKLGKGDEQRLITCLERNMKVMAAAGARELHTMQPNIEPFIFEADEESRIDNPRFKKWIEALKKAGITPISAGLVSVHQLGSCRMGVSPKVSAVKPTGETWEVKNLYVADGSLLPTAVGVNPMVTIEALALKVARHAAQSSARL
ncbi:Long-chain-alcohol oxidase FAO4A [Choanephora cucurbitarum]|uniref:Long-chain-alcohol oxidase n=1 Tax=Choanephora cucurbitarum TaxID=101091 RepID=A0A1C7NDF1_9FUNG|nr:Long-chain-alcohol oxidase FAO4A [Choanephora cucurbitarum]